MNNEKFSNKWSMAGLSASAAASLCCIVPVLALVSGVSGAASSLSWLETWRPYLVGLSLVLLGWAWYQQLKPQKAAADCGCEVEKRSFFQGRSFLAVVTVLAGLLMAFPAYAHIFYRNGANRDNTFTVADHRPGVSLHIRGLGCADCEGLINNKLAGKKGVLGSDTTRVSVYKVGLVCNADPSIGCGSRSKPVLLALEGKPAVKEAWLNRQGTMIAVVWKERDETEQVAGPVFRENGVPFVRLSNNEAMPYRAELGQGNLWYRGADVDALSREEAATIAMSAVRYALESKLITQEEAAKIRTDLETYFRSELVKVRTAAQLSEDSQGKFREAMFNISEKYIGNARTIEAMKLYHEHCRKQCTKDSAYAIPGTTDDCCKKSN